MNIYPYGSLKLTFFLSSMHKLVVYNLNDIFKHGHRVMLNWLGLVFDLVVISYDYHFLDIC